RIPAIGLPAARPMRAVTLSSPRTRGQATSIAQPPWPRVAHEGISGHYRRRYTGHLPLSRARQQQGTTLRHRRRPRGLYLVGRATGHEDGRAADWNSPEEMIARQPYLPRFMAGRETNPLGVSILATNQPPTIGAFVSSGCIRLTEHVMDLYSRVRIGTRTLVLPGRPPATEAALPHAPAGASCHPAVGR